ncbi:MAG: PIN domain-containing protein [Thermoleophilia bacterium]|nr:PIN domain-containing protein [Thermoleophilia bacterium]
MALLKDEPAADEVADLLREGVAMPAVNLCEALDVLGRVDRVEPARLRELVEPLLIGPVTVTQTTARHAWRAAELRRRRYHRTRSPLSLADCLALATVGGEDVVATADPPMLEAARAEGIATHPLPDTGGRRWSAPSA